jgi:hypothetical protein
MKKSLLLLPFILYHLGLKSSYAQEMVWCPKGAQWHYQAGTFAITGYSELKYANDTIVDGINCKKLIECVQTMNWPDSSLNPVNCSKSHFTYESNGVVYAYGYNDTYGYSFWDTLFNFKAVPGQSWHLFLANADEFVEVIDTGHQIIQNINLKWLTVTYPNSVQSFIVDTIFERLGSVTYNYPFFPSVLSTDPEIYNFCNYSDSLFSDWNNSDVYCTFLPTGISWPNDEEIFSISPNPAFGEVTFITTDKGICSIADQRGKIIEIIKIRELKTKFSTENLQSGIYMISFLNDEFLYISKLIIQH